VKSDTHPRPAAPQWLIDHVMSIAAQDEDPQVTSRLRRALKGATVPSRDRLIEHAWNAGLSAEGMRLLLATADRLWSAPAAPLERGRHCGRRTV
jgi:hypothetical protein